MNLDRVYRRWTLEMFRDLVPVREPRLAWVSFKNEYGLNGLARPTDQGHRPQPSLLIFSFRNLLRPVSFLPQNIGLGTELLDAVDVLSISKHQSRVLGSKVQLATKQVAASWTVGDLPRRQRSCSWKP